MGNTTWSESCRPGGVHRVGDDVEAIAEQVPVEVEAHRGRLVPEHLLDDLDVRSGGNGQGRRSVPQCVRVQAVDAHGLSCRVERDATEVADPKGATLRCDEHQSIRWPTGDMRGEVIDEEPRDRHVAALVTLRRAPHQTTLGDLGDRFGDRRAPADEVEPTNTQGRQLAEPDAGVGEEQDREPIPAAGVGEGGHLLVGEVAALGRNDAGQGDALRGVAGEASVADGGGEDER